MKNRTVLISGASVAGPALAYWLRRYGFHPTVVERAPAPRAGGQAIDLRGTARAVVDRMGLMADVRQAHTGVRGMAFVNGAGRRVASIGAVMFGDSGGPIADIEILRGDLVRILYGATRDDVEYLFDDSVTALTDGDDGVKVTFERAAPRTFDLVVGADGVHSTVRGLAFGPESRYARDLGCYISIFTAPNRLDLDGLALMYTIPGGDGARGMTAALYPVPDRTRALAMLLFSSPPLPHDRRDSATQRKIVADAFAGQDWEVPHMLAAMGHAPDFYFDRICQVDMRSWSTGRVVLLGDAGYCGSPLAGNGTSMALVGAYVLAGELAAAAGDHRAAFARYEHEMRDYVTQCQGFAKGGAGALLPKSSAQVWFRNQGIRTLRYMPWRNMIAGSLQKTANAVTLKDYRT